jgi:hypothetical protein
MWLIFTLLVPKSKNCSMQPGELVRFLNVHYFVFGLLCVLVLIGCVEMVLFSSFSSVKWLGITTYVSTRFMRRFLFCFISKKKGKICAPKSRATMTAGSVFVITTWELLWRDACERFASPYACRTCLHGRRMRTSCRPLRPEDPPPWLTLVSGSLAPPWHLRDSSGVVGSKTLEVE